MYRQQDVLSEEDNLIIEFVASYPGHGMQKRELENDKAILLIILSKRGSWKTIYVMTRSIKILVRK